MRVLIGGARLELGLGLRLKLSSHIVRVVTILVKNLILHFVQTTCKTTDRYKTCTHTWNIRLKWVGGKVI